MYQNYILKTLFQVELKPKNQNAPKFFLLNYDDELNNILENKI